MPTYTFQCQSCGEMKDVWRHMNDRDKAPERCERCGKPEMQRMFTAVGFSFTDGGHKGEYTKYGPRKGR